MSVISADLHNVLSLAAPMTLFSGMIIAGLRYPSAKFDFLKSPERGLVKFQRKNLRMARVSDRSVGFGLIFTDIRSTCNSKLMTMKYLYVNCVCL